jgi:hypothetical protein
MNNIQVMLSDEQSASLKEFIYTITRESIEEAQRVVKSDREFLKQKYAAQWLGVSVNKFKEFEDAGMPTIIIDGMKLYSKKEMSKWILKHQK